MCRQYGVSVRELALAYTEIVATMRQPFVSGHKTQLVPTAMFTRPGELEEFLREIHRVAHGQTALQRHLAIINCARRRALTLAGTSSEKNAERTKTKLLKTSIEAKMPVIFICMILVAAGTLLAVYLV